jgi:hypothetical protein
VQHKVIYDAGGLYEVLGDEPEAHKSIYDYRQQLKAKRRRKKRRLW